MSVLAVRDPECRLADKAKGVLIYAFALVVELGQQSVLICQLQRLYHLEYISVHKAIKTVYCHTYSVVGNSVLREVVRPDLLRPISAADLSLTVGCVFAFALEL